MNLVNSALAFALVLSCAACATTESAGRRIDGGGMGPGLGPIPEPNAPLHVEEREPPAPLPPREPPEPRERPSFRIESDCWVCR